MDAPSNAEFEALARYLIGRSPARELAERYTKAVEKLEIPPLRGLEIDAINNRFLLPFVDAGEAAMDPDAPLRQRLLVCAAVLEATPEGAGDFLPVNRGPIATVLLLFLLGLYGVILRVIGVFVVFFARKS